MKRCPSCGMRLDYEPDSCPQCLRPFHDESANRHFAEESDTVVADGESLRSIARFTNAAEAGFFAHTLMFAEEIPATIRAEDNFDGVGGYWSTCFHLEVPKRMAASASRTLQSLIDRSEREDFVESLAERNNRWDEDVVSTRFSGFARSEDSVERSGFRWTPIVLTLAAGSLAYFGLRAMQPADKPRAGIPVGRQKDLWDEVSQPGKPWVQKLDGNRRRELRFNPAGSRAVIEEYKGKEKTSEREFDVPQK